MDGEHSAAELRTLVTVWFKDVGILVDLLKSYIRKGVGRYTYFACTLNEETDAVGELLQQRSINAEQMERELRLMETILQPWQVIQQNKQLWELFQLAHAALQQFSTASGRYSNSTAFFALPDAAREVLNWSHDVRAFYGLTDILDKNQSAQLKRVQELCPLSESELSDFQTRLDSEQAQILSILEQRQQRETQQQLLQTLSRQPAVQPPAALNIVASYVPTNNPAQSAANRLQMLHNDFRDIRSPKQLTDSMAELGCVIYQLCQEGLLPKYGILQDLGQSAENSKVQRPHNSELADHCYQSLCIQAADIFSSRDRLLIRPPATDVMQTDWGNDFAEQGHRFALFISELMTQLQAVEPSKPEAIQEQKQTSTNQQPTNKRRRTDPSIHSSKLRQKIANGYQYKSYEQLRKDIGGAKGTWTKIFNDAENIDLLEWKDNRGVYARNNQAAVEQLSCEPEVYLSDEEVEILFTEEVKKLPKDKRDLALEQFRNMEPDKRRRFIQGFRS